MSHFKKSADNIKVNFVDTNFNQKGYYVWKKKDVTISKKKEESYTIRSPYIQLCIEDNINKNMTNINEYFNKINEKTIELSHDQIEIQHIKIMKKNNEIKHNQFIIYDGKKKSREDLENTYIKSFFHKERDRLWKIIQEIHFNPTSFYKIGQSPRIGILLHGPPGTGKSTLAFRIAMALDRDIVSIDIRSIRNKHDVYKTLRSPCINGINYEPKQLVYIFDEFDLTVRELHAKKTQMTNVYESWIKHLAHLPEVSKMLPLIKTKSKITKSLCHSDSDSDDSSDSKKNNYSIDNHGYDTEDLSLEDLLEILQGPVPLEGAIIIATTNKYEEIKDLCPALFRPGRLTPIHFDLADNWFLNEICQYFYQKDFDEPINLREYNISPSYLTQLASESTFVLGDKYEYFKTHLLESIKK
jgi:SpoVK/Ycf46/Vps4 family AAA+-type ATPase